MKIPLAFSLKNRNSTTTKDARILNGFVEPPKQKGGAVLTYKRPALDSTYELATGSGQGLYVPSTPDGVTPAGEPGVIIGDILTRAPTPLAKRVRFNVQPSNVALNTAISPSVTVRILDAFGHVVNSTANVTVALATNPTSATLGGTVTQAAVAGVATFNNLTLNHSGLDFTLSAASGVLEGAISNAFTVATHLVFTTQPTDTGANSQFTVAVTARDSAGATDTNYNGFITVAIYGGAGGTLGGNLQRLAVNGVATFGDLTIDTGGTYTLRATAESSTTAYTPTLAISNSFVITNYTLTAAAFTSGGNNLVGFFTALGGGITPATLNGQAVEGLYTNTSGNATVFQLSGTLSQNFFTSITVGSSTVTSASATFLQFGGSTIWAWAATSLFPIAGTYAVQVT